MKRIFTFAAMLVATAAVSFGQTIKDPTFFENMYVGVNGGFQTPLMDHPSINHLKTRGIVGLEFGKDFTPVVGFSIDGNLIFKQGDETGAVQKTYVDGNAKINLSNWIGGYKGFPRRVEFLLVPGIGWGHSRNWYGEMNNFDPNFVALNTFAQVNLNLGQQRAWFVYLKPGVVWDVYNMTNYKGATDVLAGIFRSSAADFRLTAGIAYRFGSKRTGSHNFVLCPFSVTKEDYDKVIAQRDALQAELNKGPKIVEKEVIKENRVEVPVYMPVNTFIAFNLGSAVINPVDKIRLKQWVNSIPADKAITVTGSADSATGNQKINDALCAKRAEAVKNYIINECGKDASLVNVATQMDINPELNAASRAAVVEFK